MHWFKKRPGHCGLSSGLTSNPKLLRKLHIKLLQVWCCVKWLMLGASFSKWHRCWMSLSLSLNMWYGKSAENWKQCFWTTTRLEAQWRMHKLNIFYKAHPCRSTKLVSFGVPYFLHYTSLQFSHERKTTTTPKLFTLLFAKLRKCRARWAAGPTWLEGSNVIQEKLESRS